MIWAERWRAWKERATVYEASLPQYIKSLSESGELFATRLST